MDNKVFKKGYIYHIRNMIDDMIYVGRTIDIDRRWDTHKKNVAEGTWGLYKHMKKIGIQYFYFQIICEVDYICDGDIHKVEMMELFKRNKNKFWTTYLLY